LNIGGWITGAAGAITVPGSLTTAGFTSTGIDDNATSTAITIDSSENVGIGTDNPTNKLEVIGTAAIHGGTNQAALVVANTDSAGSDTTYGWTSRSNRILTSNGTNWASDGKDAAVVIGSSDTSTTRKNVGILLHNESQANNDFSPALMFTSRSNSGSYNSAYGYIMGKRTGQGQDANWNIGEIHIDTAGTRSGSNARSAYLDDDPAFKIDESGDISTPYRSFAEGQFGGSNLTNGTGWTMSVQSSQNMTYQNNAAHGWGLTVQKAGYYQMFGSSLYTAGSLGYVYIGWCINGTMQHHWHSNHTVSNNHDFVSSIIHYCNIGDHITMENGSASVSSQWAGTHSVFHVLKVI